MAKGIEIREAHFPGRAPIEAYGNGGFRFADMSHRGSLLCLPSGIYGWDATEGSPFSGDRLGKVFEEAEEIRFLLYGTGTDIRRLPPALARPNEAGRHLLRSDVDGGGGPHVQHHAVRGTARRRGADRRRLSPWRRPGPVNDG